MWGDWEIERLEDSRAYEEREPKSSSITPSLLIYWRASKANALANLSLYHERFTSSIYIFSGRSYTRRQEAGRVIARKSFPVAMCKSIERAAKPCALYRSTYISMCTASYIQMYIWKYTRPSRRSIERRRKRTSGRRNARERRETIIVVGRKKNEHS